MADEPQQSGAVDTSDNVRHGSEEARKAAMEKMQAAIAAKKSGNDIETDTATLEADVDVSQKPETKEEAKIRKGLKILSNVKVYSPFHVYYDGEATSVSASNLTGPFDILAGHKNFMSLLTPCEVVVRSARGEERIKIDRGIMHVRSNAVAIFLDV